VRKSKFESALASYTPEPDSENLNPQFEPKCDVPQSLKEIFQISFKNKKRNKQRKKAKPTASAGEGLGELLPEGKFK
jgi:hypothetical protein